MKNVVLVTGANRGLGLGFVEHYLSKGWYVIGTCRSIKQAHALEELKNHYSNDLQIESLEVTDESSISNFICHIQHLKLDLVINNAGICIEEQLGKWTLATFTKIFQVNTIGVALLSQVVWPLMQPKSKLINVSSGLGSISLNISPEANFDAYAMSKAALNMFTARLAAKLKSKDIWVVAMSPGWVKTRMGGAEALLTVSQSIYKMAKLIDGLNSEDSGKFYSEEGDRKPW
ncbi:SDR family oxidoreductase [Tamlana fucoidanivorans]|uniref:SDR family oxidoreductase n=1 Tax=Allotamlana fucoidanivorans TaxID=2583814 RepID=A0A5C4SK66_9FLAO|nr:SDR family oxidoreductase [Tamlana fucoidanivorans]TNJ43803.1 SDR family oxidoreductase [Tamlana fucoidanivorans]